MSKRCFGNWSGKRPSLAAIVCASAALFAVASTNATPETSGATRTTASAARADEPEEAQERKTTRETTLEPKLDAELDADADSDSELDSERGRAAETTREKRRGTERGTERWTRTPKSRFVRIVEETRRSVVSIQGEKQCEIGRRAQGGAQYDVFNGMGTGVVVDERGYILTNYHVVKGLLKLEVVDADGERYRDVELIRNDVATDLAILKIDPKKPMKKIRMGRSDRVALAEDVYAIGNPYGYSGTVSRGVVSALGRPLEVSDSLSYDSVIQTDAAINPGNSGGPLINVDGEMIGLNAAVREDAENIAFAIPIDVVSAVVERMLRQSVAKMTHHGLKFRVVGPEESEYPSGGDGRDVLIVDSVDPKSPAAIAGVEPGDELVSSNGFEVRTPLDFTCSLIGLGLFDSADLVVERGDEELETSLAFGGLSDDRNETLVARRRPISGGSAKRASKTRSASVASAEKEGAGRVELKSARSSSSRGRDESPASEPSERIVDVADESPSLSILDVADSGSRSVAGSGSEGETDANVGASLKVSDADAFRAARVWEVLGLEIEPTTAEEYRERFPSLRAVTIGEFNFVPNGGVDVVKVDPNGATARGDAKIRPGDLIFGFGVGSAKDGQLSVASLDNLYYVAQKKDELARVDGGKARVYLIRDGKPYFLEIDLNR